MQQEKFVPAAGRNLKMLILAVVIGALMFTAVPLVLAYVKQSAPLTTLVGDYQVTLLTDPRNESTSEWTYEISVVTPTNALGHWVLGIGDCYKLNIGEEYTTPEGAKYRVEYGSDSANTGVYGIKFDGSDPQLGSTNETTHTFIITIASNSLPLHGEGPIDVGLKYGRTNVSGTIRGPICAPTAVKLTSLNARSGAQSPLLALALAFGGVVAAGAAVHELRKND